MTLSVHPCRLHLSDSFLFYDSGDSCDGDSFIWMEKENGERLNRSGKGEASPTSEEEIQRGWGRREGKWSNPGAQLS
jgi:hypothetical protein